MDGLDANKEPSHDACRILDITAGRIVTDATDAVLRRDIGLPSRTLSGRFRLRRFFLPSLSVLGDGRAIDRMTNSGCLI
jgi:hypothetical protein